MPDSHPMNRAQRQSPAIPFDVSPGETSEGLQGNRPATGARQASPGQVLSQAFQGSATAGDFLGLDLEVNEASSPGGLEIASVNPYGAPAPDVAPAAPASAFPRPPAPRPEFGAEQSFDDEELLEQPTKRTVGPQAAVAFVVGLVAVVGIAVAPRFLKKEDAQPAASSGSTVASAPSRPAPDNAPSDLAGEVAPEGAQSTTTGDPAGYEQPEDAAGYEQPHDELSGEELGTDVLATPSTGAGVPEDGDSSSLGDLFRRFTEGDSSAPVSALPGFDQGARIEGTTFDASLFTPESWMSGELVDMVWRDTAVPVEAIAHPVRVMTPRVGPVRVHLDTGVTMEGRLYAVGQNRVWLDSDMGRLGIDGEHVVEFEHLSTQEPQPATFSEPSVGTGRRVRVQVPGGVLYGRVLSVVDTRVTLITDEGARVCLESPEIEPLGPSRAILVER